MLALIIHIQEQKIPLLCQSTNNQSHRPARLCVTILYNTLPTHPNKLPTTSLLIKSSGWQLTQLNIQELSQPHYQRKRAAPRQRKRIKQY